MRWRWNWIGIGAIGLLVLMVAACGDTDTELDSGPRGFGGADSPARLETDGDAAAPPAEGGGTVALQTGVRKVIFESRLELVAADVTERYYEVGDIARRAGGFVADSRLTASDRSGHEPDARIVVRVPSERREDVLADIRRMDGSELRSEQTTSTEVTDEYMDLQSRLRNLQRSEQRYLELLDRAQAVSDILAVGERLDSVRSQIEQLQGRINVLDDLVDLATITVAIQAAEAVGDEEDPELGFVSAWNSAWGTAAEAGRVLLAGSAWATVAIICLAPIAIVGGGIRMAAHRREQAAE